MNGINLFELQAQQQKAMRKRLYKHGETLHHARNCTADECLELLEALMNNMLNRHGLEFGLQDVIEKIKEAKQEPKLCAHCNGSGEGMYEGTKCYVCKGSGTDKANVVCGCYQCDDCQSTKGCANE